MTADGTEDQRITPEGLPNYKVPPPLSFIPLLGADPESNFPDSSTGEDEGDEEVLNDDTEQAPNEGSEWVDDENDRSYDDELYEQKLKTLYSNGWFTGKIDYHNNSINKYRVVFSDGTEDYIGVEDIDGVEIMLLD